MKGLLVFLLVAPLVAQTFNSGSNGSDGALNLVTPGIVEYDPAAMGLDLDGDGVMHFTTINVGVGVTLKFRATKWNAPVYWLASGNVTIAGSLDLNGERGHIAANRLVDRVPAIPGSGGFAGGVGNLGGAGQPGSSGSGPLGGRTVMNSENCGRNPSNQFLVPLNAGSGGAGSTVEGNGGGAGGGALLIASSGAINALGPIQANGGGVGANAGGGNAGGGGGGAIRLVANTIAVSGTITALPGCGVRGVPATRLEAFSVTGTGTIDPNPVISTPVASFVPSAGAPPSVRVTSIGGIPVPASPTGSFVVPDVVVNSGAAVTVLVEAKNIPRGTKVSLIFYTENAPDQTILTGDLSGASDALTTASASVTLAPGYSKGYAKANWVQ